MNRSEEPYFVVVLNIPFRVRWQTLKDVSRDATPNIEHVEIYQHQDGRSKGQGYVRVKSEQDALQLIERLNQTVLDGRQLWAGWGVQKQDHRGRLTVSTAYDCQRDNAGLEQTAEHENRPPAQLPPVVTQPYANMSGLNFVAYPQVSGDARQMAQNAMPPPNASSSFIETESRGIFVSGLPYEASLEDLKRQFGAVGFVEDIDAPQQRRGKLKGWAAIRYSSIEEAERAVARFNNTDFGRRKITVRRDVVHTPKDSRPTAQY